MVPAVSQSHTASNGVSLENVAEEVLNGIFCHYEPPTSEEAQRKAAEEATHFPTKYGTQVRKKSILRPSRLERKQKVQTLRNVTWRDEEKKSNPIESKISSCAMDQCNLFGSSTGDGIADTMPEVPMKMQSVMQKQTATTVPLKTETTPNSEDAELPTVPGKASKKKVLYDDEGNPIDDETDHPQDENIPPASRNQQGRSQYYRDVPFGRPGDQIPIMDEDPNDPGVYEPESYGRSSPSNVAAFKRMRSPPMPGLPRNYRLDEEVEVEMGWGRGRDNVESLGRVPPSSRSRSNSPSQIGRSSGGQYQVASSKPAGSPRKGLGWMKKLAGRPSTPHRRRISKDGDLEYDSDDDLDRLPPSPRDSYSAERGRSRSPREFDDYNDESNHDYFQHRGRRSSRSPSRRTDVYSDLTTDYISEVPTDRYDTPPRRRSRSPGRRDYYPMEDPYFHDRRSQQSIRSYDSQRDQDGQDYSDELRSSRTIDFDRPHPRDFYRRSSREYDDDVDRPYYSDAHYRQDSREYEDVYDRRRSNRGDYRGDREGSSLRYPEDDDVDRDEARDAQRRYEEDFQRRYDAKVRRSRRESDPIPSRRTRRREISIEEAEQDTYEHKRPHTTTSAEYRRGPQPLCCVDTTYGGDANFRGRQKDPTPRMSSEGTDAPEFSESRVQLPPTPRMPGQTQTTRDEKIERVARPSTTERRNDGTKNNGRPRVDTKDETDEEKYARTRKALMRQLSPTSLATDDEIREDVSSVGMQSDTIRPLNYPNPFLQVPPPILEETATNGDYSDDDRERSTLSSDKRSNSTLSSKQPIPKESDRPTAIQAVSNSSSRSSGSKKYWKGWKKSFGMVKNIVKEIDEKRIPAPVLPGPTDAANSGKRQTE